MPDFRREDGVRAPQDINGIVGVAGAGLGVIAAGSAILSVLPGPDLWMTCAAYVAPASLAFAAYWWMSQRD